jgi:transcriptional regulator with XRE-family HTH domain
MAKKKKPKDIVLLKTFGKHLKKVREQRDCTQEDLAHDSDLAVSQVARIESGQNTTISSLFAICKALNLSVQDFFKDFKN